MIAKILLDITESKTVENIRVIWQQNHQIIMDTCTEIENSIERIIRESTNYSVSNQCSSNYQLKTCNMSVKHKHLNGLLNNTFSLVDVLSDGNCLFRTFADLILYDQQKYVCIKLFIINEILCNELKYSPIIYYGDIPVVDEEKNIMQFPKVDDFLRMVARENVWGNNGSFYAISTALRINVVVIGVDRVTHTIVNITKYAPINTRSTIPITLINELNWHFIAAHRKSNSPRFETEIWEHQLISNVKVDLLISHYRDKFEKRNERTQNITEETYLLDDSTEISMTKTSCKVSNILERIFETKNLSEIQSIVETNHQFISELCNDIRNNQITSYKETIGDHKNIRKNRFPKELLDNFEIVNVEGDGNCFYRSIAYLMFNDERKYGFVKLFMIDNILVNLKYYDVLCSTDVIEVVTLNNERLTNPKADDFIRMVAGDKIWGNEGSMLAISHALKIKLFTFCINIQSEIDMIVESGPNSSQSSSFLTVFNTNNTHYYAARCNNKIINNSIINIQQGIWKDLPYVRYELVELYNTWISDYINLMKETENITF